MAAKGIGRPREFDLDEAVDEAMRGLALRFSFQSYPMTFTANLLLVHVEEAQGRKTKCLLTSGRIVPTFGFKGVRWTQVR